MQILITTTKQDVRIFGVTEASEILKDLSDNDFGLMNFELVQIGDSRAYIVITEFNRGNHMGFYINHSYSNIDITEGG